MLALKKNILIYFSFIYNKLDFSFSIIPRFHPQLVPKNMDVCGFCVGLLKWSVSNGLSGLKCWIA